jgi:hypothetical protein
LKNRETLSVGNILNGQLFSDADEYIDHIRDAFHYALPCTQLLHFLVKKRLGHNPVKESVPIFGKEGYGIYQQLIDHWNDYSVPPAAC